MQNLLLSVIAPSKYIYYFGTTDMVLFVSCIMFGFLGCVVMLLIAVGRRDPTTTYSPPHFSWEFFFRDNASKILLDIILVVVFIRFIPELFKQPINQFYAFLIGLGSDKLADYAKIARDKLIPLDSTIKTTTFSAKVTSISDDAQNVVDEIKQETTTQNTPIQEEPHNT